MKSTGLCVTICVVCIVVAMSVGGCTSNTPVVVTVTPSLVTIEMGKTESLQATSTSTQDTSFTWTSADTGIATVDQTGLVTGVAEGQTTVTAKGSSSATEGQAAITVKLPAGALSDFGITVDTSIVPASAALPPFTSGAPPRALAAIVDEHGNQTEFVEDELMIVTDDAAALDAFVTRWGGEVLATADPAGSGLNIAQTHLVRINTALGDPSQLNHDVLTLDPRSRGASRVSSDAGLRLISANAKEAVAGVKVGMNWVGHGSSLGSGSTTEAGTGPGGFNSAGSGYSPNAFNWNFLDSGSKQDIGVTRAWELLANARKLSNKVKVAVLDMGFSVTGNADIPGGWVAVSNVPLEDPTNNANLLSCSGGNPCPWHGTEVVDAAMGVPDNAFGAAGPAGPVAQPILIFTLYDFFTSITALIEAGYQGAQVVNMSYGAGVPAALFFTVGPFDLATAAAGEFMVVCAAAGNDGKDVDSEDCFLSVCWEDTWWTPCENDGVFCVGGLKKNSQYRDPGSNYGHEDVDIFAPFVVIVGPTPDSGPGAQEVAGTSFSSPYVAGVAALVLAANPSLSASDVRDLLFSTGHSSPDNQVLKYVDAYAAVSAAMPPVITIQLPQNGATIHGGLGISLEAFVFEAGLGTPTVQWTSSIDGNIGTGVNTSFNNISFGTHTITATAAFPDSTTLHDSVTVTVINDPPEVTITSPTNGANYLQGQPVLLSATSIDINEVSGHLSDAQISWYVDNVFFGNNHSRTIAGGTLSVGSHTVRVDGTDGTFTTSASVNITTNPNPADLPPDQVNILNPTPGEELASLVQTDAAGFYFILAMEGNAHDPEDGDLTGAALAWTLSVDNSAPQALGTGGGITKRFDLGHVKAAKSGIPYDFTLTATDSAHNTSSVTVHTTLTLIVK